MPLDIVSMAIYVTLEGKIPRTPFSNAFIREVLISFYTANDSEASLW